jgi:hypothetical protein
MNDANKIQQQAFYIIGIVVLLLVIMVLAWPIQSLWNSVLVSALSCCREITYWQAVGFEVFVFILGRIFNMNANIPKND